MCFREDQLWNFVRVSSVVFVWKVTFLLKSLGSVRTWRQRCVFSVVMCEQLHWWQCNLSLTTCWQRQKSVSLSPSANGPLQQNCRKEWNYVRNVKLPVSINHNVISHCITSVLSLHFSVQAWRTSVFNVWGYVLELLQAWIPKWNTNIAKILKFL